MEMRPLDRSHYPAHLARHVSEGYEVLYRAERRIAPSSRSEIGMRRAHVARLLRPRGVMGRLTDVEEEPVHVEIDPPEPAVDREEFGPF